MNRWQIGNVRITRIIEMELADRVIQIRGSQQSFHITFAEGFR